jgi:speckle-type POZ protein
MAEAPATIPLDGTNTTTLSTYRASVVQGTHRFHLDSYSLLKTRPAATITSDAFRVAGHRWNIACSFDNRRLERVCLHWLPTETDQWKANQVTATPTVTIQHPSGDPLADMRVGRSRPETFSTNSDVSHVSTHSVPEAFQDRDMEARYLSNDRLTVCCTLQVFDAKTDDAAITRNYIVGLVAAPPSPSITRSLLHLLETGQGSDVTFHLPGSELIIKAHKIVLAMRSPVFKAKFFGNTKDSIQHQFKVDDMSATVLAAMLHFLYTDDLPLPTDDMSYEDTYQLLVAADLYDLERLRAACEKKLSEGVDDVATAMSMLILVNGRHSCRQLEDVCVAYIASDPEAWKAAMATEAYMELKKTRPSVLNNILEKVTTHRLRTPTAEDAHHRQVGVVVESSSAYRPLGVSRGTHEFTIFGHSGVKKMHVRDLSYCIYSGRFRVGGHHWRLRYYPSEHAYDDDYRKQVKAGNYMYSIYLELLSPPYPEPQLLDDDDVVTAAATFKIFSHADTGGEDDTWVFRFCHDFHHNDLLYGCFPVAQQAWNAGPYNRLIIRCELDVTTTPSAGGTGCGGGVDIMDVPTASNISWHLELLLRSSLGSDVAFLVDQEKFCAHSLILSARSPALLEEAHDATAAAAAPRTIEGMTSLVFGALLHFIYTDDLPPLDDLVMRMHAAAAAAAGDDHTPSWSESRVKMAGDLLAAADRYQMTERMVPICENLLCSVVTPATSVAVLALAQRHHRPGLKAFCLDYLASPDVLEIVMRTEAYRDLKASSLGGQVLGELMERMLTIN